MTRPSTHWNQRTGVTSTVLVRQARVTVLAVALLSSSACYTYAAVPVSQPLVEQRAEFRLNDAGRVQLSQQLGPGALAVEGRIVREDDSGWTLRVFRLTTVGGDVSTWTGEVVQVQRSAVELVSRRDFDRQRSVLATAAAAGAVTLFVLSRSLLGGGTAPGDGSGPPSGEAIRF
jgi:hypothetical protein